MGGSSVTRSASALIGRGAAGSVVRAVNTGVQNLNAARNILIEAGEKAKSMRQSLRGTGSVEYKEKLESVATPMINRLVSKSSKLQSEGTKLIGKNNVSRYEAQLSAKENRAQQTARNRLTNYQLSKLALERNRFNRVARQTTQGLAALTGRNVSR